MAFLGETSSQTIVNSRLGFIFSNGSIIHNDSRVYFQNNARLTATQINTMITKYHLQMFVTSIRIIEKLTGD